MKNPKFEGLKPEQQEKILSHYYDKYVVPGYQLGGLKAPDKDLWIRSVPELSKKKDLTKDYLFPSTNTKQMMDTLAGASTEGGKVANTISYGGVTLSKAAAHSLLGLSHFFGIGEDVAQDLSNATDKMVTLADRRIDSVSHDALDKDNFWLQSHPSKKWTDHVDSFVGENLLTLPFYEAIGAGRVFSVNAASEILPQTGKIANMTKWLATSKSGQFVAKRLGEGSDALIGSMLQGASPSESLGNMAAFMGFGSALDSPKLVASASRMLIKKFSGQTLAMGGQPLVEAISNQAAKELKDFTIGHFHDGSEIRLVPESGESGYIMMGDQKLEYKTKDQQQTLVSKVLSLHREIDPVRSSLMNGEKLILSQMAHDQHGVPWQKLTESQQKDILAERNSLSAEASNELPLHNPDLAKAHIDSQLQQDVEENPKLGERIQEIQKASGLDTSSVLQGTEKEQIEAQTGIQNSQASAKKTAKIKDPVKLSAQTKEAREQEPRQFYQFKVDTLSYLKSAANKLGKVSYKNLGEEIGEMDEPHEFTRALQEQLGASHIKFEDDKHALLWANQFRNQLPKEFQKALQNSLHDLNPLETQKVWDTQSQNLSTHMEELAQTGRLFSQGNVFRSTKVENWLSKTKWQRELRQEVEDIEMQRLTKTLNRYPELKQAAISLTKKLQQVRAKSENAGTYKYISDEIRDTKTVKDWRQRLGLKGAK